MAVNTYNLDTQKAEAEAQELKSIPVALHSEILFHT